MKMSMPESASDRFDAVFPDRREFDVVGFGQNTVDHVCVLPEYPRIDTKTEILRYEKLPGGQIATAVVFASRLGLSCKYIGKIGSDENGRLSAESLRQERIDLSSLSIAEGARNHCSIIMVDSGSGERTIIWDRDRLLTYPVAELHRADICAGRVLLLDGHDQEAAAQAARWAAEEGVAVVADLDRVEANSAQLLGSVDFLIASADFPSELAGLADPQASLLALRKQCHGFLAVTLGASGAMAVLGERCCRFPGFRVRAVDTTGAGDIFHGAFVYGLLQNWPVGEIMSFANAAAALSCAHLGARSVTPRLDEILELRRLPDPS